MSLRHFLVHLDQTPPSAGRFHLALTLAQQHRARLAAFYATSAPYFSQGIAEQQRAEQRSLCAAKAAQFGVDFDWLEVEPSQSGRPLTTLVNQQAFFADLVIVGQPGPGSGPPSGPPRDLPERLVLTSGRPVLTVPFAGSFPRAGDRVLVAWKAGRSSARAVYDARPFLSRAREVLVVSFAYSAGEQAEDERTQRSLAHYLAQYGVKIRREQRLVSGISPGDALLNRVAEEGTDLLVSGGLAPNQIGPVAEHLLAHMTVPVLMSS